LAVWLSVLLGIASSREWIHAVVAEEVFGMVLLAQSINTAAHDRSLATIAYVVALCVIMSLAEGLTILLKEGTTIEGTTAVRAHEALLMPLLIDSIDHATRSRVIASRTTGLEGALVAALAVRHPILLKEAASGEGFATAVANEAINVPLLIHSADAAIGNGLPTETAHRAVHVGVACLAVGLSISFIEACSTKRFLASTTHPMIRVVLLAQGLNALSQDWFPIHLVSDVLGGPRRGNLLAEPALATASTDTIVNRAHLVGQGAEKVVDVGRSVGGSATTTTLCRGGRWVLSRSTWGIPCSASSRRRSTSTSRTVTAGGGRC
jgi:hypothetical protein